MRLITSGWDSAMPLKGLFTIVMAVALSACASGSAGPVLTTGDRFAAASSAIEDYKLGVGDKVRMTIFNETGLSGEFAVSSNGSLSLPLIGDVPAQGKEVADVAKDVQAKLGDGYLRDPKVSMEVITYRPFFILGEVKTPGSYPYTIGLTALNAVATAEGFTPRSDRRVVYIRQSGATGEEAYRLSPDLRVLPGDTIRIGERYF